MTTFDITVLVLLGASLIYSFFRGMIREIFSILAYVVGYFMALKFNEAAAVYLGDFLSNKLFAEIAGFSLVFILVSISIKLLGKWLQNFMNSAGGISGFDKVMGGTLGLMKGFFILALVMIPLDFFPKIAHNVSRDSVLAPYLRQFSLVLRQNMFSGEKAQRKSADQNFDLGEKVSSGFEGMKEKLSAFKKIQDLVGDTDKIKDKMKSFIPSDNAPQDEHPEKSKKELEKLLRSRLNN